MQYVQIIFPVVSPAESDMLIAVLSEIGFEGFEEAAPVLNAFIGEKHFDESVFIQVVEKFKLDYSKELIEETNWNEVWESNFPPVVVDDFVAVRAEFHAPIAGVEQDILITPKMSFGTGHHATTYMMMQEMRKMDFAGQAVLDFGTGTGVLAILAEKLGASKVIAIDNDDWSINNARENIAKNNCTKIALVQAENAILDTRFGIILANINKHIILENMVTLAAEIEEGGTLLLSGLLAADKDEVEAAATSAGLKPVSVNQRLNWLVLKLYRPVKQY